MPEPTPNFRTLDLNLLRVFDEVMAERSLTRAARNLSLTQPAVSNALRRLRGALGDELVRRSGQGVEPTPRGMALWPDVRDALRQLQHALAPDRFEPTTADDAFILAMADATAAELVAPLLGLIEREAPGVSLRVLPLDTRDPRKQLELEQLDLALGHFPAVLADLAARAQVGKAVSFNHRRLYDSEYVCVMRADHAMAKGPMTLNRYCSARHLLVSFSGKPFGFVDTALQALGRKRHIVVTMSQFFTAARLVADSDLLTVLPRHFLACTGFAQLLHVCPLPFAVPTVQVDALWHARKDSSGAHRWLREAVARSARGALASAAP